MPGFSTVDAVVNAWSVNGTGQKLMFSKVMPSVSVANIPHTLWKATGLPAAGSDTSAGGGNARVLTDATTGAMIYNNATSPATQHLMSFGATPVTASATGTLVLVDRIADCNIGMTSGTTTFSPNIDATSRLASGEGAMLWLEVTTAFQASTNTLTFTYTNQAGTGSRTTAISTTASVIVGRTVNNNLWQPLAAGDNGVRSIQSVAVTSSITGALNVCLVKPLAMIPMPTVGVYVERDFVVEIPNLVKLYDDSCLALIYIPTAAVTATMFGEVRVASN